VFVVVENAVTTVLRSVGALSTVIGMSKGSGVRVVFAVIGVTMSSTWPITVGAMSYSTVYCVRH
jgi:hypothetical protein